MRRPVERGQYTSLTYTDRLDELKIDPSVGSKGDAYDNADSRALAADYALTPHIRSRGEEIDLKARHPDWRARRWVVEACHSWLNRNRAILIRWSKKDENHLALLQLASGLIALKKAHAARLALAQPG